MSPSAPANVRAIVRVSSEFLLRSIDSLVRSQGDDLISALVFTAISTANIRHITQSAANFTFAGPDDLPPDSLRRPVSVQSVAAVLGMPYETVRRYAQELIRTEQCIRIGKQGLIVPAAALRQVQRQRAVQEGLPNLLRFLSDLKRAGLDFAPYRQILPSTVALPASGALPENTRALLRVSMDAIMRGIATMASLHKGDFLRSLIYTAIWIANVHHITGSGDNLKFGALEELPPDAMRRPVTINAIAGSLRLPYETTRRYVGQLAKDGAVKRIEGKGVIVPREHMEQRGHFDAVMQTYNDAVQVVGELHRAGFDFHKY